MNAMKAIASAFRRVGSRKRMIVLYWFFQTLCAALAAVPLMGLVVPEVSHSLYGAELLRGFDVMFVAEWMGAAGSAAGANVVLAVAAAGMLAMLGSVFLAGGAVKLLVRDEVRYSPSEFWAGCGENFWRFLRLMLYSLIFYGLVLALGGGISKAADKLWGEGLEARPLVYASWARLTLLILLGGLISTAMDFAKVRLVADGSRKSLRACFGSVRLVIRWARTVLPVWLVLGAMLVLATWGYVSVANGMAATSMVSIVLLFAWQQLFVLARVCLRMMSWGAAAALDSELRPRAAVPAEAPAEAVEVVVEEDFSI